MAMALPARSGSEYYEQQLKARVQGTVDVCRYCSAVVQCSGITMHGYESTLVYKCEMCGGTHTEVVQVTTGF